MRKIKKRKPNVSERYEMNHGYAKSGQKKITRGLALLAKKEMFRPLDKKLIAENLRISQERFEDEMEELYYRETVNKTEIEKLADEILDAL